MTAKNVTATDFRNHAGVYLDEAGKTPIIITKHNRPSRVLLDIAEYERLKRYDTRRALDPRDLDEDLKAALREGYQGEATPDLDHLLK